MNKILLAILPFLFMGNFVAAQTVSGPQGYRVIDLGNNGVGDYTQSLILLHEAWSGGLLPMNNAIGTISGCRGNQFTFNRLNVANINTSSAYNGTNGMVESITTDAVWKLKTCVYMGTKYLALDVPYSPAFQNGGFQFAGWVNSSSGVYMKLINYMVNGQPVNQDVISNIQDFTPNMAQTVDVSRFVITGNVGIGTTDPGSYKLAVKGGVHAQSVQVDMTGWSDLVFKPAYNLPPLADVKNYIDQNHHLPDVPSEEQVRKEGIDLGEMNSKLLKKIEELTLYLIQQQEDTDRRIKALEKQMEKKRSAFK